MPSIDQRLDQIKDALYRVSAKAIILRDNKILLTQETKRWWSLPGGGIDHGETATSTLKRELAEEIGVSPATILVNEHVRAAAIGEIVDGIPRVALLYEVSLKGEKIKKSEHILDYGWFSAHEVAQLYVSPTIGGKAALLKIIQEI